ncbi:CaiB/BaiF CoA transferase family protein [Chloroflexota bacterium]
MLLAGYTCLDLTDEKGWFCGKILSDLGARVIKIEQPGGDRGREKGPRWEDKPGIQGGLPWLSYNQGKEGITLDVRQPKGKSTFQRLVEKCDIVVESFDPGYMDEIGLGYEVLSKINPGIIMTSISLFGQSGPYRDYKGNDLTMMATSGHLFVTGDSDRPPVRENVEQAYCHGAGHAAAASLMALWYRENTGVGQFIDISIHMVLARLCLTTLIWWQAKRKLVMRKGNSRGDRGGGMPQRVTWSCKDGQISCSIYGGAVGAQGNHALVNWMQSEGMADEYLKSIKWENFSDSDATEDEWKSIYSQFEQFFLTHTKHELYQRAIRDKIMLMPVNNLAEIYQDAQLASRHYWTEVEHPEAGAKLLHPGDYVMGRPERVCRTGRRAPLIGEDNEEVYLNFLGLSRQEFKELEREGIV